MKLIPQEIVDNAAWDYAEETKDTTNGMFYADSQDAFKAGVKFAEEEVLKHIEDIIIENQGLKMNQDLSIEFFIWTQISNISNRKLKYGLPSTKDKFDINLLAKELFEIFLKERNKINGDENFK